MRFHVRTLLVLAHLVPPIIVGIWLGAGVRPIAVGVAVYFGALALTRRFLTSDSISRY